jgi:two-component system response regulator YesN
MTKSLSVLIAEDELPTRRGVLNSLEQCSQGEWHVHAAENGLEALEYATAQPVDLLITDIRMPGLDGIELLNRLRMENKELVSILLTGYAEFEYARAAVRLGVVNYLLKPVDHDSLIHAVREAIGIVKQRKLLGEQGSPDEGSYFPKVRNESIRRALEYIKTEHSRASLSVKDVAEHIYLNPSYVSVLFKEETKQTFTEFMSRLRLTRAKELLLQTDKKVYEIAESVGFSSSKYFVHVFRDAEGMTPYQFRMQHTDSHHMLERR